MFILENVFGYESERIKKAKIVNDLNEIYKKNTESKENEKVVKKYISVEELKQKFSDDLKAHTKEIIEEDLYKAYLDKEAKKILDNHEKFLEKKEKEKEIALRKKMEEKEKEELRK